MATTVTERDDESDALKGLEVDDFATVVANRANREVAGGDPMGLVLGHFLPFLLLVTLHGGSDIRTLKMLSNRTPERMKKN